MKKLVLSVMPLLLGTEAYGMMRGAGASAENLNPEGILRAGAGATTATVLETSDQVEECYRQQFRADFEGQEQLLTLSPEEVLHFFCSLKVSSKQEGLLTQLLGMTFSFHTSPEEEVLAQANTTFFETAKREVLAKGAPATTYTDLYTRHIRPLRGYYTLWVSDNWSGEKLLDVFTENLRNVRKLGLARKNLAFVNADLFHIFIGLETLDLSENDLHVSPDISRCALLRKLHLSFNRLRVPTDVSQCYQVEILDLAHNQLREAPDVACCPLLKLMDLGFNELTVAPNLNLCPELVELHLSHNHLIVVPHLREHQRLTQVHLSNNHLTTFPALAIDSLSNLIVLDLRDSPLLPEGGEGQWGRRELHAHFDNRVLMDDPSVAQSMKATTTSEEVYGELSEVFPHINFKAFEGVFPPEVPGEAFTPQGMIAALEHM